MNPRETIYAALFTQVSSVQGFQTVSRRLKHYADVSPADQPALYLTQRGESAKGVPGLNQVWTLDVDLVIYVHTNGDPAIGPGSLFNPLVDAIVAALAPNPVTNKQTLGGLVEHAWIEGQIATDEGVLGDQGVAIVPIRILTA